MTACLALIFDLLRVSRPFSPVYQEIRHQDRIRLTDAVRTIFSLSGNDVPADRAQRTQRVAPP